MDVRELDENQMTELKQRWYTDYINETENRGVSMSELADINSLVSDDTMYEEYKNTTFVRDDFDCTAGTTKYQFVEYDVYADGDDTWQVNTCYKTDKFVVIDNDADADEVLKVLVAEKIFVKDALTDVDVDFSCSDSGYVEFFDNKDYFKPIGRLEEVA